MQRGQASLEYVAVVAVVTVALALGAAVAGAEAVPRAVAAQVERAFCLVSGGDCLGDRGPRACTIRAGTRTKERRGKAFVVRLADGRVVLTEERSDGTVAVTVADHGEAMVSKKVPGAARGMVGARLSAGRTWVVPDAAAARRLVERLDRDRRPVGEVGRFLRAGHEGDADERFVRFGARGEVAGGLRALGLHGEGLAQITGGVRVERVSGRRTLELLGDGEVGGALSASLAGVTGKGRREVAIEVTLDGDRPLELTVRNVLDVHGTVRVGPGRATGGNRLEADVRLDLTEPHAAGLMRALLEDPSAPRAVVLGRYLLEHGRIDVRLYATDAKTKRDRRLFGALETIEATHDARLLEAYGRDPGMGWTRRLDCVGMA